MIIFDYNKQKNLAHIRWDSDSNIVKWNKIRRIIEDNSQISTSINLYEIALPWWCFLNIRSELVKALRLENISIQLTDVASKLLSSAQQNEMRYMNKEEDFLNEEDMQKRLSSLGFSRKLTFHQMRNLRLLMKYPSAATFSVPGAGKTTEALAFYTLNKCKNDKLLVVSPRNAFAAWEEEMKNCIPLNTPHISRLHGSNTIDRTMENDAEVYLITYQQFYRVENIIAKHLNDNDYFMFLDESHRMKRGYSGVYGSSLLGVCHLPKYKLIMTGTPLPNAIEDLVPQFTFLYPEIFIDSDNVVSKIQHLYVRTTKNELGLKPPLRKEWSFDMKEAQRELYENVVFESRRNIQGLKLSDRMLFHEISKCMVRLIQITTDPGLLITTEIGQSGLMKKAIDEGPGVKIEEACHLARNLASNGEKSIIWTQFVKTVEGVSDMLSDLNAMYIHGGVETDEDEDNHASRESIIKKFHDDPSCMVLVANPAACAEGISLHKVCHNAIYIDRNYNAAHYLQSEDRIHRLGLDPNQETNIHILTCTNSIDNAIGRRLQMKIARMGKVLNDRGLSIEPLQIIDEVNGLSFEDADDFRRLILGVK